MPATSISHLPDELLLLILEFLDTPPPSLTKSRLEPKLDLTASSTLTYKNVSRVSRRWRRVGLSVLFRCSHLRLDIDERSHWCRALCTESTISQACVSSDQYHIDLINEAIELNNLPGIGQKSELEGAMWRSSLRWACRFYHASKDFLDFVQRNKLEPHVHSFAITTRKTLPGHDRFPHREAATKDYRFPAVAAMWQHLYSVINPSRIVILAPPADLACLVNCAIDIFGEWAFSDMDYHILDLRIDTYETRPLPATTPLAIRDLDCIPREYPGVAGSSILKLRPWTHLSLNEGSFIKAYGTYEYFERGPPSLVYSIKDCISSRRPPTKQGPASDLGVNLEALRSFSYTAILPFANHLDFRSLLPHLDEIDIQIAPHPTELGTILSDRDRVGRAELEDCWQELFTAYRLITKPFWTHQISQDGKPRLKRFICQDVQIPALQSDLDDEFTLLCLPCWAEMEPGVFVRHHDAPHLLYSSSEE